MNFPAKKIDLDFGCDVVLAPVFAKQYDNESRILEITPLNYGQKLEVDNDVTVRFLLTKPDGSSIINDATIEEGIIIVELTDQILAVAGKATAEIAFYKDEKRLSSQVFYIDIQKAAYSEDNIKSSNEFTSFDDSIKAANEALEKAEEAKKAADDAASNAEEATSAANKAAERVETAIKSANTAKEEAQNLVEDITQKLEKGEFKGEKGERGEQGPQGVQGEKGNPGENGKDGESYKLTSSDMDEIAKRVETYETAMQGGTVTYKIPLEECIIELANNDSSAQGLATILIPFGTITANTMQLEEDLETGVIEIPEDFYTWEFAEQEKFMLDIYTPYISTFNIKPWAPKPRKPWLEFLVDFAALNSGIFEQSVEIASLFGIESDGIGTMFLNKIFNNDFKVSIFAENQAGEVAYNAIESDITLHMSTLNVENPFMIPFFGFVGEEDETGIATITLGVLAVGILSGYGSLLTGFSSYIVKDDIKEIDITFIPNNAVVEDYDDE